jgi:hypothetical protein
VSEEAIVEDWTTDDSGCVLVVGKRVFGASPKISLQVKRTWTSVCQRQRCGGSVENPIVLWHRFEQALGRDFYWFGPDTRLTIQCWCAECLEKYS